MTNNTKQILKAIETKHDQATTSDQRWVLEAIQELLESGDITPREAIRQLRVNGFAA
jgi:hypothetical protein